MGDKQNIVFVKLNDKEIYNKISLLVLQKRSVKIWHNREKFFEMEAHDIVSASNKKSLKICLSFDYELDVDFLERREILFGFTIGDIQYFSKGLIDQKKRKDKIVVSISDEFYKCEKRMSERLLSFPHHKVYLYLKIFRKGDDNVIFLNRSSEDQTEVFKQVLKLNRKKLIDKQEDNYFGFRVLDISISGISFIANIHERKLLLQQNSFDDAILSFNGKNYNLKKLSIIYDIDYIDPRAMTIPMYKLGINYNCDDLKLYSKIIELLGDVPIREDVKKEFEDLICK